MWKKGIIFNYKFNTHTMTNQTITLTQTQINQAINALEEANRVLHNIKPQTFTQHEDISNLQKEIKAAWKTLSLAQHIQIYLND